MTIEAKPDKHARIVRRRLDEMKENMQRTIDGIKNLAEGSKPPAVTALKRNQPDHA